MKVVSLFSGCGGFDLGFIKAGYKVIWANDNNKNACRTYAHNISKDIVCDDIRNIKSEGIPNDFDVLIGGFPCQGFSVNNANRHVDDERNFLYREMLRVLRDKRPKFFVAENVKGLLSLGNGEVIKKIISDFSNLGYKVDYYLLNAKDYNVPQSRERVFIVGGLDKSVPSPKQPKIKPISTRQAIGWLSDVRCQDLAFLHKQHPVYNHVARTNVKDTFIARKHEVDQAVICDYLRANKTLSSRKIDDHFGYKDTAAHWFRKDKWGSLPSPEQWIMLKNLLRFDDTHDKVMTEVIEKEITFEQAKRISVWNKPSHTITATNPEIHPNKKRRLSVRECAILQSFPSTFIFCGSVTSMYRQVGNAVPPNLAYHIAKTIRRLL